MKVTDSTRSTGSITATYKPLSDSAWQELGARDPQLPSGDYKIQVGDLDNRSSLQFIDPKGHTLTRRRTMRWSLPSVPHSANNSEGWLIQPFLFSCYANVCVA